MAEDRVIEVEPEPIESPAVLGEADRWLAEQREKIRAKRDTFHAVEGLTPENYADAKAQLGALNALISQVSDDKKRMTAPIRNAIRKFDMDTSAVLSELREEKDRYNGEINAYKQRVIERKMHDLAGRYEDEYPDVAAMAPLDRLRDARPDLIKVTYSSTTASDWRGVEKAAEAVAADLATLRAQTHVNGVELTEDDRRDVVADYLRTLSLADAQRACIGRVERREALRHAEEERRAWEAEQAARQASIEYDAAMPAEPEPVTVQASDDVPTEEPDRAAERARETVYVYEVEVPEGVMPRFLVEMKRLGTHGRLLRKE